MNLKDKYLKINIDKPLMYFRGGHFISSDLPWEHPDRSINTYEIIVMASGKAYLEQAGHKYRLNKGDLLCFLPGINHRSFMPSDEPLSFYWLHMQGDIEVVKDLEPNQEEKYVYIPIHESFSSTESIIILFNQLMHLENNDYKSSALNYALTGLVHEIDHQVQALKSMDAKIHQINKWIDANYSNKLDYIMIADHFGYNKDYLNKYYSKQTGITINKHIQKVRLKKSKSLLTDTRLSVKEIAHQVGYKDVKVFSKQFKASENLTPSAYRKCFYGKYYNRK
ncbi:AraC family transcriptional regulator [Acidaminobacter sp. JC074]|uniref:AraC family transcriptional regulator n=1 Tax=Acidaminobacter sp. JC074 TaxID=2530199 RepID=UPI001F105195|nr:AraC family transcriptional regulator [Acidaminobacter sp. JC074]MCH4889519.1 AraC family transcriptional regulator [Acidaminobacter sp. JC074]